MGRKKPAKSQKQKSAIRHNEDATVRWRLHQTLVRVNRDNEPIPVKQRELAKAMLNSGAAAPPANTPSQTPVPPDNVLEFIQKKSKKQNISVSGNEAETLPDPPVKESWTSKENTALKVEMEISFLRSLAKRNRISLPMAHTLRKDSKGTPLVLTKKTWNGYKEWSWNSNRDRWKALAGHTSEYAFRKYKVSGGYVPKTPSGKPVSDFVAGGKHAPPNKESPVVYTKQAANDQAPDMWNVKDMLAWFINTVDVCHWPKFITDYVLWTDHLGVASDTPRVDVGAVRKSASKGEDRLLLKSMLVAVSDHLKQVEEDSEGLRAQNNIMGYELAHHTGDLESAGEIRKDLYGSAYPKPPENADRLISEFNLYRKFKASEGEPVAWSRFMYGTPEPGVAIQKHMDKLAEERQAAVEERMAVRAEVWKLEEIAKNVRERTKNNLSRVRYPEIRRYREAWALRRIKNKSVAVPELQSIRADYLAGRMSKREMQLRIRCIEWPERKVVGVSRSLYYKRFRYKQLEQDSILYALWGNKVTALNRRKPVNYQQVINKTVGVRSVCYTSPKLIEGYSKLGVKHKKIMNEKVARSFMPQTLGGKFSSFSKKVVDILNTELNPVERKRVKDAKRLRSQAKWERKKAKKAKIAAAKTAVKDAEYKLSGRGFVVVDSFGNESKL